MEIILTSLISIPIGIIAGFLANSIYHRYVNRTKISWEYIVAGVKNILTEIEKREKEFDYVVGIGRGGALIGAILAGNLGGLPLLTVTYSRKFRENGKGKSKSRITKVDSIPEIRPGKRKRVLLVRSTNASGETLATVLAELQKQWATENCTIETAAIFQGVAPKIFVDYFSYGIDNKDSETIFTKLPWMITPKYRQSFRPD